MFTSPHLRTIPTIFSSEDRARLKSAVMLRPHQVTILYENLLSRYGDFPYLLVRLAQLRAAMGSPVLSAALFSKAYEALDKIGVHDAELDYYMTTFVPDTFSKYEKLFESSLKVQYHQSWKQTEEHNFPRQIHAPPSGYEQVKEEWSSLVKDNSEFLAKYLRHVAVETNIIEDTFLLTTECLHNIIRDGVSPAIIVTEYDSETHDRDIIKSILNDTLEAYEAMLLLARTPVNLTRRTICHIHSLLMKTCQFHNFDGRYVPPGRTRTETMQTVIVGSSRPIQCCPYAKVDDELDAICRISEKWIDTSDSSLAAASWLHLVLARCHPFNDGNGRLSRIMASIPLIQAGYPPIAISMIRRPMYYQAINEAYDGNHSLFIQCIFEGMKATMDTVRGLL
ncbi:hypothetical protein H2248_007971 [Termitomyces sp. 'cryptogamus']|nr:hypothetical protein H2248_007971 [Termitomyces sp. 'cryptogamus']